MANSTTNWFQIIHRKIETYYDIDQTISEEEFEKRSVSCIDAFHFVFLRIAKELRIRDTWPESFCHIFPFSTGIIEKSGKMGVSFTIGVGMEGWFVEASLAPPEHIRHMSDEFWAHIVKLSMIGKVEFQNGGRPRHWPKAETKKLVQHKGSLVFQIMRDYTLLTTDPDNYDRFGGIDLGRIAISLPLESSEEEVLDFLKEGLNSLYSANYLLHRSAYLEQKRQRSAA